MRAPLTPVKVGVFLASLFVLPAQATTVLDFEGFGTGRIINNEMPGLRSVPRTGAVVRMWPLPLTLKTLPVAILI